MNKTKEHYLNIMQHALYCVLPTGETGPIISDPILFDTVKEASQWLRTQRIPYHFIICDNLGNPL